MRRAALALLLLAGCAGPTAAGDRLARAGDYDGAVDAYDTAAKRNLTDDEQAKIRRQRRQAIRAQLDARLAEVVKMDAAAARKELAVLYADAAQAAEPDELSAEITEAAVTVSEPELQAIEAKIAAGAVAEALDELFALSQELIASEVANTRVLAVRSHAAKHLRERANASGPDVAALLGLWADRMDYSDVRATSFLAPDVQLATPTELCGQPIDFGVAGLKVQVNATCESRVEQDTASETYIRGELEEYQAYKKVCTAVKTYEKSTQQVRRKVYDGVYYDVWETGVETTFTPRYKADCQQVPYSAARVVDVERTRTYALRHIAAGVAGSVTVWLDSGPVTLPLQASITGSVRAEPLSPDSPDSKFVNDEATDVARFYERMPATLQLEVQRLARIALRDQAIAQHQAAPSAAEGRQAAARAVLYGANVPADLADLGIEVGAPFAWLDNRDAELLAVEQTRIVYQTGYANQRFEIGFSTLRWDIAARNIRMSDLSVQPDRIGYGLQLGMEASFLSTLIAQRDDPYGLVFFDELGWNLTAGARTSKGFRYPGGGDTGPKENGFFYEAGVGAQFLVGFRTHHFGLLGGMRGHATTHTIGDAAAGSAALPFAARMELMFSQRHPIVIEAWAFSPVADRGAFGGELTFAIGDITNLLIMGAYQEADTRIRGLNEFDLVNLGRRPNLLLSAGLQLAGIGDF